MTRNHVENLAASGSSKVHVGNNNIYQIVQEKNDKEDERIRALFQTNPSNDKKEILALKGELLQETALTWILRHDQYTRWVNGSSGNVLWIRGDAGKGKTMMLCNIIDNFKGKDKLDFVTEQPNKKAVPVAEAEAYVNEEGLPSGYLSYFFCQATNQKNNNATAVLRGLIAGLVRPGFRGSKDERVWSHVAKELAFCGPNPFDSWGDISNILTAILRGQEMRETVLAVDALDECENHDDRSKLLNFIAQTSCNIPWVKWAVTSRKLPDIEDDLSKRKTSIIVDLETEEMSVSEAVVVFINKRLGTLRWWKSPDDGIQQEIRDEMTEKANNTFLWVALVCQELKKTMKPFAHQVVKDFPRGLVPLYERMMRLVLNRDPAPAELCKDILAIVSNVYRPLSLEELASLVESPYDYQKDLQSLREAVQMCGSFLTLRNDTVFIVHQSAKEFLVNEAQDVIMPRGIAKQHHQIFARSLEVLSTTLKRNICSLKDPGSPVSASSQNDSFLKLIMYACIYWVDHFDGSIIRPEPEHDAERGDILIDGFLHDHLLHWLEALSLLNSMPKAVSSLRDLKYLLANTDVLRLRCLVQDAHRFISTHRASIEVAPLQVYGSALVFSPVQSVVRQHFQAEAPTWITKNSMVEEEWDACIQVLEGHTSQIYAIAFSADNSYIASGCHAGFVRVWDAATGACVKTFHSEDNIIDSIVFSADRGLLCSGWGLHHNPHAVYIRVWDPEKDTFKTMAGTNRCQVASSTLSLDGKWLACRTHDRTIRIWDTASGICERCLKTEYQIGPVAFSKDNKWLVSGSAFCGTVTIWSVTKWEYQRTLEGNLTAISCFAVSGDCRLLASRDFGGTIIIWEITTGISKQTFRIPRKGHYVLAMSEDGRLLATDGDARGQYWIWDTTTGKRLQTLNGNQRITNVSAFSAVGQNGQQFVSGDSTIEIWDIKESLHAQALPLHTDYVTSLALSADLKWAASGSGDRTVRIWDAETMTCMQHLTGHTDGISLLLFFPDNRRLVSYAGYKEEVMVWDFKTGALLHTLSNIGRIKSFAFLPNGQNLAIYSSDYKIRVWDFEITGCARSLPIRSAPESVALSADCQSLILMHSDGSIEMWSVDSWECLRTIQTGITHPEYTSTTSVAISSNSQWAAVGHSKETADGTLVIQNLETGHSTSSDNFRLKLRHLMFDKDNGNRLNTNVGSFDLHSCASGKEQAGSCAMEMRRNGYGISCDNKWILKDEKRMLWIPEKHRPLLSAMIGSTLIIGCQSGHVQRITFLMDNSHSRSISTTAPAKSRDRSPPISALPSKRQRLHRA